MSEDEFKIVYDEYIGTSDHQVPHIYSQFEQQLSDTLHAEFGRCINNMQIILSDFFLALAAATVKDTDLEAVSTDCNDTSGSSESEHSTADQLQAQANLLADQLTQATTAVEKLQSENEALHSELQSLRSAFNGSQKKLVEVSTQNEQLLLKLRAETDKTQQLLNESARLKRDAAGNAKQASFNITSSSSKSSSSDASMHVKPVQPMSSKRLLKFSDVAGVSEAKAALYEAVILPLQCPQIFRGARKPWRRILLYGPPGTGKTLLASAVAGEVRCAFYSVSSADLLSSFVGESEKLVRRLFTDAAASPNRSVIFIDEVDSICRKRTAQEDEYARRIKTELLTQTEGLNSFQDNVFLLCATNKPWDLDNAFLQRFQKRIYIPLPDLSSRLQLLRLHLADTKSSISESQLGEIAQLAEGCSGRDMQNLITAAVHNPVRELLRTTWWIKTIGGAGERYVPALEGCAGSFCAAMSSLPADLLDTRAVNFDDFKSVLHHSAGRTVSSDELLLYDTFTTQFGLVG